MKAAILLLALASIMHSFALEEEPFTSGDKPMFIASGVSWHSSLNQFFLSRTSGSSVVVVDSGASHTRHAKYSIRKFLGMKAVRGFKAQALDMDTSMLWRVEVISSCFRHIAVENYLVGYDLKKLVASKTLRKEVSYKLPGKKDYTALTVSPAGIVFVIDSHGGILKIDPKQKATPSMSSKSIVKILVPSQTKGAGSPLGIVYDDKGEFLIVAKFQFQLTLTFVDPDDGKSMALQLDTNLPLGSTKPTRCSPPQILSLHNQYVVVLASDHIHLVRYTLEAGFHSSSSTARIVESLKIEDGALALFPTSSDLSISLFYLSRRRKHTFFYYVREYEFSPIDVTFLTNGTSLALSRDSFMLEKPVSFATSSSVSEVTSLISSHNQIIKSYSNGAIVTYDDESLLKLAEHSSIVHQVVNQMFDESSGILWRIERLNAGRPALYWIAGYKLNRLTDSNSTAVIVTEFLPLYSDPVGVALGPGRTILCLSSRGSLREYIWEEEKERLILSQKLRLGRNRFVRVPFVQPDVGFFVVQDPEESELLRVDVYFSNPRPIRIVNSTSTISSICWGIVFLRGGRHLVIGHEQHVFLLQGVTPGLRWEQARIVATIDISNLGPQGRFSALSLTSNDLEVAFISGGIWYKISVKPSEVASPPLLMRRDPILLWRHKFSNKLSPEGIAFDHSRMQLIVSYSSGIGIHKVSHFIPSTSATSFSKSPRFGSSLLFSLPTTWRLEYLENSTYLVPYLRNEDTFIPFWREHIELPQDEVAYTGLVMSPTGILFVVDSCGGILEVDVRGAFAKPKRITGANEDVGSRGIVYLNDRFLLVGNSHTGVLTRVDVKSGARRRMSVVPAQLPAASASRPPSVYPLGLALLPDGRLSVLHAGRLFLLQDASVRDGAWSSAHVVGSLPIADPDREQALPFSLADPNEGTIVVLSKCREENLYQFYTIALPRQVEGESTSSSSSR